ncbi:hypothetical protein FIBSPDRAFT_255738 [Athelia psychrophila]|uniref:Uncharacterized protein n=1 Tax=Athelia psychrophila TaxID=1759441 RepID=A0A165XLU9_9AGAM|nr:hypothetical protein FIBSPDRAFT_255738 [Fibularhizoctonia sp. CBS 109695]
MGLGAVICPAVDRPFPIPLRASYQYPVLISRIHVFSPTSIAPCSKSSCLHVSVSILELPAACSCAKLALLDVQFCT